MGEQKNGRVSSLFTEHRVAPVQFDLKTLERYITPTSVLLLSTSFLRLTFHRQTEGAKHTSESSCEKWQTTCGKTLNISSRSSTSTSTRKVVTTSGTLPLTTRSTKKDTGSTGCARTQTKVKETRYSMAWSTRQSVQ